MKRTVVTSLMFTLFVVGFAGLAMAQGSAADSPSPTGAWNAVISAVDVPMPPFHALMTFGRDGTLIVSQAALVDMPYVGTWVFSDAHGAWKRNASGQITFKFLSLLHDMHGAFMGTSGVSATCSIDQAGAKLSCTASAADYLPDGTPLFGFPATLNATRITAD